jgi:hypothetical protein
VRMRRGPPPRRSRVSIEPKYQRVLRRLPLKSSAIPLGVFPPQAARKDSGDIRRVPTERPAVDLVVVGRYAPGALGGALADRSVVTPVAPWGVASSREHTESRRHASRRALRAARYVGCLRRASVPCGRSACGKRTSGPWTVAKISRRSRALSGGKTATSLAVSSISVITLLAGADGRG